MSQTKLQSMAKTFFSTNLTVLCHKHYKHVTFVMSQTYLWFCHTKNIGKFHKHSLDYGSLVKVINRTLFNGTNKILVDVTNITTVRGSGQEHISLVILCRTSAYRWYPKCRASCEIM